MPEDEKKVASRRPLTAKALRGAIFEKRNAQVATRRRIAT